MTIDSVLVSIHDIYIHIYITWFYKNKDDDLFTTTGNLQDRLSVQQEYRNQNIRLCLCEH